MKKQIFSACALIASVAAFATSVESANTFGVLKVDASAADGKTAQLIIPVPWEDVGGNGQITATNYVLSTGRIAGDKLYWYDNTESAYKVWEIEANGGPWTPKSTYTIGKDNYEVTAPEAGATIARGQAVILGLANGSTQPIYLSGQYNSSAVKTCIYGVADETLKAKLFRVSTLIAPSTAVAKNISDVSDGATVEKFFRAYDGQQIELPEKFTPQKTFLEYHSDVVFRR